MDNVIKSSISKIKNFAQKVTTSVMDDKGFYQRGQFTPLRAVPGVNQANTFLANNTIKPMVQGAYNTAKPILNYLDPRGYQAERQSIAQGGNLGNQKMIEAGKAMVPTALNLFGLSKVRPVMAGVSGLIGGGMSKATGGSFQEGWQKGMAATPTIAGISAFTNPLISGLGTAAATSSKLSPVVSKIGQGAVNRITQGFANIPEGMIMNKAMGIKDYGAMDLAADFGFGLLGADRPRSGNKVRVKGFGELYQSDVQNVKKILSQAKNNFKLPDGNVDIKSFQRATNDAELYRKVFNLTTNKQELAEWKALPLEGQYKMIASKMQDLWSSGSQITMGIKAQEAPKPEKPKLTLAPDGKIKSKFPKVEVKMPDGFNAQKYIDENVQIQKKTLQGGQMKLGDSIKTAFKEVKRNFVERYAPIIDPLNEYSKKYKVDILPQRNVDNQISRVLSSNTIASQLLRDMGFENTIRGLETKQDIDGLGEYLLAKRNMSLDVPTGRDKIKDQALVEALSSKYEEPARQVNEMYRKLTQMAIDQGMVDKNAAEALLKENPDYVRFERLFSPEEIDLKQKGSKGIASISKQSTIQKMEGSDRAIQNPLVSLIERTYKIVNEIERNKAAGMIIDYRNIPDNPYGLTPLRTADNVQKRIDLYSELKETKPLKNKMERLIKTRSRSTRRLQSELNTLNKLGIEQYLKRPDIQDELVQPFVSKIKQKQYWNRPDIVTDTGDTFKGKATLVDNKFEDIGVKPTNSQVRSLIKDLIATEPNKLKTIKNKIAFREPRLKSLIEEIETVQKDLDYINLKRKELFNEARLVSDAEARGKSTISRFKNGIKEIWEVNKEVADAAKNLNAEQMGVLARIASFPVRAFKASTTGLRIPFIATNIVRDQLTAFINSSKPAQTSLLNPRVTMHAIMQAVGHGDTYQKLVREGAIGTSFDIYRNQPKITIDEIYARRNAPTKVLYKITHPTQLLRSFENVLARGEEFTRIQQFEGTYKAFLKEGRNPRDAEILAAQAARQNTADFQRMGEAARVINWIIPYFSAGIAGAKSLVGAARKDPVGTGVKFTASVALPMVASTLWNLQTEDRKAAYDDLSDFEKENNFIFIPPNPTQDEQGRWDIIKVPITPGLANLANIVRMSTLQIVDNAPIEASKIFTDLLAAGTSINLDKPGAFIPQAIKPAVEVMTNKNTFTNKEIVPNYLQNKPPEEQVYPWTSGTVRQMGKLTGQSPLQLQHLIKGYGGATATDVIGGVDKLLASQGIIPEKQASSMDIVDSTTARFTKGYGGETKKKLKEEVTKGWDSKLNSAYDYIHAPKTLDENGLPSRNRNETMGFAQIRLANPQIVAREAQEARLQSKTEGTPLNPLYELPYDKQRTVLTLATLPPGEQKSALQTQNIEWLKGYWKEVGDYSNSMKALGIFKDNPNYQAPPVASARAQALMDQKQWNDPEVRAYLEANKAYKNNVLAELGLPPLEDSSKGWGKFKPKVKKVGKVTVRKAPKAKLTKFKVKKLKSSKIKSIRAPRIKPVKVKLQARKVKFPKFGT